VITRAGHAPVVIVSLDDYQSLKETAYLLRSPENARRLITAMQRLETGDGEQRDLVERGSPGTNTPGTTTCGGRPRIVSPQAHQRADQGHPAKRQRGHRQAGAPQARLQGYWSRRITDEHRLVYKVAEDTILIAACRYHYGR